MPSTCLLFPVSSSALYCRHRHSRLIWKAASSFLGRHSSSSLSCFSPIPHKEQHFVSLSLRPSHHSFRLRAFQSPPSAQSIQDERQSIPDLPPALADIVRLFQAVPEPRAKYEQLLHYGKKLKPLPKEYQTLENKVNGCVSQVWVRASMGADNKVYFEAESDSLLTKGLAALLVEGLSGCPAPDILRISPDFIQMLGLNQSLTPSRSNGFLNMLKLMQKKALELSMESEGVKVGTSDVRTEEKEVKEIKQSSTDDTAYSIISKTEEEDHGTRTGGRQERIRQSLETGLDPIVLEVQDVSYQHAGHAGVQGNATETHFNLKIISPKFEGKTLVKRHRLVYDLLQEELQSGLHALSIVAKTPAEAGQS